MQVVAGDLGGTKTLFCIAECEPGRTHIVRQQRFECADYTSFGDMLRTFLEAEKQSSAVACACFGIAGPIRDTPLGQYVKITNLPWEVNSEVLVREFGLAQVRLINDFVAVGYGIELLGGTDIVTLHAGEPVPRGPRAIIGAGTGLGQAILVWQQDHYEVIATEGSKTDFGPADELQLELARYLMQRHKRASYELVLSGSGLVRIYQFLRDRNHVAESPVVVEAMLQEDPAAVIARAGLEQNDPLSNAALDLFVAIYGQQAGNLALTAGATGGLYVAGGIAPKIISRLASGKFVRAFTDKGNMSDYVRAIPVQVVMNPEIGLLGAVSAASRLSSRRVQ